jgi:hypothetical protein
MVTRQSWWRPLIHNLVITALSNLPSGLQQAVLFVSEALGGRSDVAEGFEAEWSPYQIAPAISISDAMDDIAREETVSKGLAVVELRIET